MSHGTDDRFGITDWLEEQVTPALGSAPMWQVRGGDVALCGRLGPGLLLEVVPLANDRARLKIEGVLDPDALVEWVDRFCPERTPRARRSERTSRAAPAASSHS